MPSNFKALAGASGGEPTDANFKNVTLLLHGDGSNGAQNNTFIDSSTNNFTITRNGNTTQGSFSPYGSNWSNYFDGTSDYLTYTGGSSLNFGTGDFTIELFVFLENTGTYSPFLRPDASTTTPEFGYDFSTGQLKFEQRNGPIVSVTTTMPTNQWAHVAVSRSGTSLRLFINGAQVGSTVTNSTNWGSTYGDIRIGGSSFSSTHNVKGYISNFRVLNGTALYTGSYTVPTAPLTAITNTSLLTCADNRFRDGSTNNFTITRNGDTRVTPFSPYAPSSPYSAAANGGSTYFDGSGDYCRIASAQTALQFGTGDFTAEGWVYSTNGTGSFQHILTGGSSWTTNSGGIYWYYNAGSPYIGAAWNHVSPNPAVASGTLAVNAWHHFALVRNGNTLSLYVNGNSVSTLNVTGVSLALNNQSQTNIGGGGWDNDFAGLLSNLRVVKGTAIYTANFTPPTAPVTAISNTQLLLNGTNAAIFDSAADNDLETVGNAQISTAVKKFGTGSIYIPTGCLFIPNSTELSLGSGDWTVEFFSYNDASGSRVYFDAWNAAVSQLQMEIYSAGTNLYWVKQGGSVAITANSALTANTWQHIAVCKSGNSTRLFVNGTQVGSTYTDAENYSSTRWEIGRANGQFPINGYLDEFRITRAARYLANFTPPAAPFPDQ